MRPASLDRSRISVLAAILLPLALVATGCSSGSPDTEASGTTTPQADDTASRTAEPTTAAGVVELDEPRRLLVVAAHEEPTLELIDIADGSTESLTLDAPLSSHGSSMTESGRFLLAGHDDAVTVVDTGVWSEGHGTHFHHYSSTPAIVGQVDGPNPTHLISHGDVTTLWFDGTGEFAVIPEDSLDAGEVTVTAEVATGQPHHGFALPTHDHFFVTVPTDDMEGLPNVVGISDTDGVVQEQFDCPATHGEASLVDGAAAACSDGILLVSEDEGSWTSSYVPYPEIDEEDPFGFGSARAWILRTAPDRSLLAAPHGSSHLLVADPDTETIQSFDLEQVIPTLGVVFSGDGRLIVLTVDGSIHLVDPDDGSIDASVQAIPAFEDGDPDQPWRQIAVTGDLIYVTDPSTDQVVEIAVGEDTLSLERTIDLDFTPGFLAIANA